MQRHDRTGPQVVARPAVADQHRLRIAGADVDQIELGIVGRRLPGRGAAPFRGVGVRPGFDSRFARARRRVPLPLQRAGFRIPRLEPAGHVGVVAAGGREDVIADHRRRGRRIEVAAIIGLLLIPAFLARRRVERDQVLIGRVEEQVVPPHAETAVADRRTAEASPVVVPYLTARPRVERIGVVRGRQVEHAVDEQRRGLDVRGRDRARRGLRPLAADDRALQRRVQPGGPRQRQALHVALVDLIQRAVVAARIVAVERRPGVGRRLENLRRREAGP